ncbi:ABC transporter substrate-binding protein [Sediminivirga luteola]|uniref:ABC transporter substrate-binding protein n=1 Tax=Sediminivirga luteola TaxID=1774748 RepID=A0A8J2XJY8_9MICO|nr:ABC transporter substrate-binding protein [Sediminivirga luteola]MCI2265484.1 ABC transporter substrate-binding protein [Sediminivirga luteola]GGA10270.1 ABC transporter substrate-binding protein [Sediminivirga luteola]
MRKHRQRRNRLARTLVAAASAVSLSLLAGCVGEGVDLGPASSDRLVRAAIGGAPDQLDPHQTSSYFSFQVLENVYDTLVEPDENLQMQPALAESWDISEDQLTWTFHLREGVTFHDGSDFTAEDVVYSYTRIIDEELANAWRLATVEEVTATGEYTVEIGVSQPTPNLLTAIGGFKGMAIVSEDNAESGDIAQHPIGTGPFSFRDSRDGDYIWLESNPDYWGGAPAVDGVQFSYISEPTTAIAALRSGEVDWTDSVPPQQVEALSRDQAIALDTLVSTDYWYLAMNQDREPWSDERVRQAVAYAVDRDSIAQVVGYGTAVVNQLAIPETSPWYAAYDRYSLDPGQAQELMDEAGVSEASMDLMVSTDYPETVTAAQVIADNLAAIGIDVSIRTLDMATWLDDQDQGEFDALIMGWLGNLDPDDYYYAQHHSEGPSNAQGYANPDVDELLDAGRQELDEDRRRELYAEAATLIADDVSYLYLYNPSVIQAHAQRLTGYEMRSDRAVRFRDVNLEEDA